MIILDENNLYKLKLRRTDFDSVEEEQKFIKKCTSIIRTLPEYNEWVYFIKKIQGFDTCCITNENDEATKINIHHHPLPLFDITSIILENFKLNNKEFFSIDIISEVIELHFKNNIGFVPLVASLHEKYHNGCLIIPPKFVQGNWQYILKNYYVHEDYILKASHLMNENLNNIKQDFNNWPEISKN